MDKKHPDPIFIRARPEEEEEQHAHGIWKIAYADFMTALMAFFLIMWLLNATDEDQRLSVASYFNPIKLVDSSPARKGIDQIQEVPPENIRQQVIDDDREPTENSENTGTTDMLTGDAAHASRPRYPESALFQDPYAILSKLANEENTDHIPSHQPSPLPGHAGNEGGRIARDPFDPAYWRRAPDGQPTPIPEQASAQAGTDSRASTPTSTQTRSGSANTAAVTPSVPPMPAMPSELAAAVNEAKKAENSAATDSKAVLADLRRDITNALHSGPNASAVPIVDVEATPEGLLISLTDDTDFSMFAIGSAEPVPAAVRIMDKIAATLASRPGRIVLRGHTDSRPFRTGSSDNWRLASSRAHMAFYMLVRGGVDRKRFLRIESYADQQLKNTNDSLAPENRRIEILLVGGSQ